MLLDNSVTAEGFFQKHHKEIRASLSDVILKNFTNIEEDDRRVAFLENIPEIKAFNDALKILCEDPRASTACGKKEIGRARILKEEGNAAVQKGDWTMALTFYTKSILFMPSKNVSDLAVVFANRSAALYHLQEYTACLEDIQMSLSLGYPVELKYKVLDRKARCYLALKWNMEAIKAFKETISVLDSSKLPNDKRHKMQTDAQVMIEILNKSLHMLNNSKNKQINQVLQGKDGKKEKVLLPQVSGKNNKMYTAASEAVAIERNDAEGRYAQASRDVSVGEIMVVEKAHCSVLLADYAQTHCFHCFKRSPYPLPCPTCSNVIFCSLQCRQEAFGSYHKYECPILRIIWDSGCSVTCHMALRILMQKPLLYFKDLKSKLKEPMTGKYQSADYRCVYNLVGHETERSKADLFQRAHMAAFLLSLLKKTDYFNITTDVVPQKKAAKVNENGLDNKSNISNDKQSEKEEKSGDEINKINEMSNLNGSFANEGKNVSNSNGNLANESDNVSNSNGNLSNENNNVSNSNGNLANESDNVSNSNGNLSNENNNVSNSNGNLSNENNNVSNLNGNLSNEDNNVSNSNGNLSNEDNNVSNSNGNLSNENNNVSNSNGNLSNEDNNVSNSNGNLSNEGESASNSNGEMLKMIDEEAGAYIGSLILKNLQVLQFNAHEIFELRCSKPSGNSQVVRKDQGKSLFIGGGLYPTLALFNHSCEPSVTRYFQGTSVIVQMVKSVKAGQQISENYGPLFTRKSYEQRKEELKDQYWFQCRCIACEQKWPKFEDMDETIMRFRCDAGAICTNVISVSVNCTEFMVKCELCQKHTNIMKGLKMLQDTVNAHKAGTQLMEKAEYGKALVKFIEELKMYEETLAPPFKDFHLCQQNIRRCLLTFGNVTMNQ